MSKTDDIATGELSKDEQIALLRSMLESAQRGYEAEIASLRSSYEARLEHKSKTHKAEIAALSEKLEILIEQIHRANAARFGAKSEKIMPEQMSLFNDMEAVFERGGREPLLGSGPKPKKPRRKARRIDTANMPTTVIEHTLADEEATCDECGTQMKDIRVQVRRIVKLIPAHFEVEEHRMHVYVCPTCSSDNAAGKENATAFKQAKMPALPLEKSWAHPSLIASVINSKYVNAMPLHRIQRDLKSIDPNMEISRQCMAGWVIKCYERWLHLIYGRLKRRLLQEDLIHFDETTTLVLKEPGRDPSRKSYMWVMASAEGSVPIHIFNYRDTRAKSVPQSLLEGWTGTIMSDCYAAYFSLENVDNLACLVHIRREFIAVIKGIPPASLAGVKSYAQDAVQMIGRMFDVDREFKDMTPDERKDARDKHLRPLFEEFRDWLYGHVDEVVPKTKLGKAFDNAIKHWPDVMRVLEDGRYPLTNNLAERVIRPFCIGRKNWEFSDTPNGAEASAGIYSIVSTARANGLAPRCYIEWLLTKMPNAEAFDEATLDRFMPWSNDVPAWVLADADVPRIAHDNPIIDVDPHLLDTEVSA